jgi:hypothetical protein
MDDGLRIYTRKTKKLPKKFSIIWSKKQQKLLETKRELPTF